MKKRKDSKRTPYRLSTLPTFTVFLTALTSCYLLLKATTGEKLFHEIIDTLQFMFAMVLLFVASVFFHLFLINIKRMRKESTTSKTK